MPNLTPSRSTGPGRPVSFILPGGNGECQRLGDEASRCPGGGGIRVTLVRVEWLAERRTYALLDVVYRSWGGGRSRSACQPNGGGGRSGTWAWARTRKR